MTKKKNGTGFSPDWCVHFRSMAVNATCLEGIDYNVLNGGTEYRRMFRLPCFIKSGDKPDQRVHCDHFKAPTEEEIALHKQQPEARPAINVPARRWGT